MVAAIDMLDPITPLREATFAVVDVETTGFDRNVDRVVEIGCVIVRGGEIVDTFSTFVDPGRPIPATASAIHHITARHVRGAPTLESIRARLTRLCADAVVVAHNATFDLGFLPFLAHRPVLCSLRFAVRTVPDAPNHKNQVLRYHLAVDDDLEPPLVAHRALDDAHVTSRILRVCLERYLAQGGVDDVDQLVREIAGPRRLATLTFGRHRGVELSSVPLDYLRWLVTTSRSASDDARHTAACELRRRAAKPANDPDGT